MKNGAVMWGNTTMSLIGNIGRANCFGVVDLSWTFLGINQLEFDYVFKKMFIPLLGLKNKMPAFSNIIT